MAFEIDRHAYAAMFGPTTGDRVRLADTDLIIEVEADRTIYGEEVKFGGGKVIRDGMGQSQASRAEGAVDTVITNALILDHWGIVKADIGIKDGRIAAIGKAGNPDVQPGVDIAHAVLKAGLERFPENVKYEPKRSVVCDVWKSAPGKAPVPGYSVIQGYDYVLFVPAVDLEFTSLNQLEQHSLLKGPVQLGIVAKRILDLPGA